MYCKGQNPEYTTASGGSLAMSGGTISGNEAYDYGGGVYIYSYGSDGGTFTMDDGTISGNTATDGGGVCVDEIGRAHV